MRPGPAPATRVLYDARSGQQHVRLFHTPRAGLCLLLDDTLQFTEAGDARYHEALVLVPMAMVQARRVLIGGGGDALAAARVLRDPEVERVVLCDFDADVLRLAREQPDLRALNEAALDDPRVEVRCGDIAALLETTEERFDLVVLDLPDALTPELGRLYTVELYRAARRVLAPGGVLVTQTCATGRAPAIVGNTLRRVFGEVRYYRCHLPGGVIAGFTLASDAPLLRRASLPPWTRFLTDEVADALFALGRDERPVSDAVATLEQPALYHERLEAHLVGELSGPYVYDAGTRCVSLGVGTGCPDLYLEALLGALEARGPVITYVDARRQDAVERLTARGYTRVKRYAHVEMTFDEAGLEALDRAESALPAGLIERVEAWRGPAEDHPEVLRLVLDYVDAGAGRGFDATVNYGVTTLPALYLIARAPGGEAVALWKVQDDRSPPEAEYFYGRGPHERNVAALVAFLRYSRANLGPSVAGLVPVPRLAALLVSLGLRLRGHVDVLRYEGPE